MFQRETTSRRLYFEQAEHLDVITGGTEKFDCFLGDFPLGAGDGAGFAVYRQLENDSKVRLPHAGSGNDSQKRIMEVSDGVAIIYERIYGRCDKSGG